MIISASRRTDIPCLYSQWFMNRMKAGVVYVRNPFNAAQIREISLRPEDVDCLVFWTKDPQPMADRLHMLDLMGYPYYFQFTLTPYGRDVERFLRDKADIEDTFIALSRQIGKERMIWRYDPIILNDLLTIDYHKRELIRMCEKLANYAGGLVISFVDKYPKSPSGLIRDISEPEMLELAEIFGSIVKVYGLKILACCEGIDLTRFGIEKGSCIDRELIGRLCARPLKLKPDRNQRTGCGCIQSVDIGRYGTCQNGCVYCYASRNGVSSPRTLHDELDKML